MTRQARLRLYALVGLVLAFKLWLASVFPFTGDEAYFAIWGAEPQPGFYDHPPMIGWLLALLLKLSWSEWVLRLPVVLLPFAIAAGIYGALAGHDPQKAGLAAIAYLLVPVNVWNVFITTDTPLVLFSFFSALAFRQGVLRRSAALFALAGGLLGLAFLSKYFAVLLALAYVAYVAAEPRGEKNWRGLALACACAAPFVAANLWWNAENCWANLMFNLYNRHAGAALSWTTPLAYALTLAYVLSPVALVQLARSRAQAGRWRPEPSVRFFAVICAAPLALFALLSAVKLIGLHWVLSFVPFFYIAAALVLSLEQLRASVAFLGLLSLVHVAAILAIGAMPLETWKNVPKYDGLAFHFNIETIVRELERYRGEYEIAADGYSPAVTAAYYAHRRRIEAVAGGGTVPAPDWRASYVFVFGPASSHARHDDILTDFRRLDGRNILIFRKSPPAPGEYLPYFGSIETRELAVSGARFHLVLGRGFDYRAYRERVLAAVRERYYSIPAYLPQRGCYFCERYFDSRSCAPTAASPRAP